MLCASKDEDLSFYGSWDTENTSMLEVLLRRCSSRPDCKSDTEITAFFREKFLIVLHNNVLFDDKNLNHRTVKRESAFKWLSINT